MTDVIFPAIVGREQNFLKVIPHNYENSYSSTFNIFPTDTYISWNVSGRENSFDVNFPGHTVGGGGGPEDKDRFS